MEVFTSLLPLIDSKKASNAGDQREAPFPRLSQRTPLVRRSSGIRELASRLRSILSYFSLPRLF
jgi:hypothetical protein